MAIIDDFSVALNGNIRYTGTTTNYTVLELHRYLSSLQYNASSSGDDLTDITDDTASNKSTDNIITLNAPYNIDDTTARHLYSGSVTQDNGDTIYSGLQIIGSFTAEPTVIQNNTKLTGYWGTSYNPNPTLGIAIDILVKSRTGGVDIDGKRIRVQPRDFGNQYREASTVLGLGSVPAAPGSIQNDPFNNTAIGTIAALTGITNTEGYQLLDLGDGSGNQPYYSQWDKGANTLAQLYEWIKWATRQGTSETLYGLNGELFRGVTHEINIDTPTGTFNAVEPVSWASGTGQMLAIDSPTAGTKMWIQLLTGVAPTDGQTITGGTSSATADVNVTVTSRSLGIESILGNFTGSWQGAYGVGFDVADLRATDTVVDLDGDTNAPPNNVTFSVNALVSTEDNVFVAPRGYKLFYDNETAGPFVVGETLTFTAPVGTATLTRLVDLGTTGIMYITEPITGSVPTNDSTITGGTSSATADVNGVVTSNVNYRQLVLNTTLIGAAETSVVTTTAIPSDTPSSGTVRVIDDNGTRISCAYSSYTGSTFTISPTDFSTVNATSGNGLFISYLDNVAASSTESFTSVYSADRTLFIRVRDGGGTPIVPFETTGTLTSAGGSVTTIRQSDV